MTKAQRIKACREDSGCSLAEAKALVENDMDDYAPEPEPLYNGKPYPHFDNQRELDE